VVRVAAEYRQNGLQVQRFNVPDRRLTLDGANLRSDYLSH